MEDRCIEAYLSSQLETFVAIVISVVHLVVPLSQDHPSHHHSQVNTLSPKVKLFDLQTEYEMMIILCGINRVYSTILVCLSTYRHMCEDQRCQKLSGLLHLGLLRASPHALSPHFVPEVPQSLKHRAERAVNGRAEYCLTNVGANVIHEFQNPDQNNIFYSFLLLLVWGI